MSKIVNIPTNMRNAINSRLSQGMFLKDIRAEFCISSNVLNRLIRQGVLIKRVKPRPHNYIALDIDKLKQAYMRGDSVLKMSRDFGVARNVITRHFKELGYHIRTGSEANLIRFANSSKEYRMQITKKAHDAVRGVKRSFTKGCLAAQSREKLANKCLELYSHCGVGEIDIFKALVDKKFNPIAQKAMEIYNVDIFIKPNIFIEVSCDPHPLKSQCVRKRCTANFVEKAKKITQNKGILIEINFVNVNVLRLFLNDIITFIQGLRFNPPLTSKHFVVACYYKNLVPNGKFHKVRGKFAVCPKKPFWEVIKIDSLPFS